MAKLIRKGKKMGELQQKSSSCTQESGEIFKCSVFFFLKRVIFRIFTNNCFSLYIDVFIVIANTQLSHMCNNFDKLDFLIKKILQFWDREIL